MAANLNVLEQAEALIDFSQFDIHGNDDQIDCVIINYTATKAPDAGRCGTLRDVPGGHGSHGHHLRSRHAKRHDDPEPMDVPQWVGPRVRTHSPGTGDAGEHRPGALAQSLQILDHAGESTDGARHARPAAAVAQLDRPAANPCHQRALRHDDRLERIVPGSRGVVCHRGAGHQSAGAWSYAAVRQARAAVLPASGETLRIAW